MTGLFQTGVKIFFVGFVFGKYKQFFGKFVKGIKNLSEEDKGKSNNMVMNNTKLI